MRNVEKSWKQHLAGWQAGAVALTIAAAGVLVAVPRAAEPRELPLPVVNPRALAQVAAQDHALARQLTLADDVVRGGGGYDVRRAGEWFRKFGEADFRRDYESVSQHRQALLGVLQEVVRQPDGPTTLLAFRAYEMSLFLKQLDAWEATGTAQPELAEVGGDFLALAERSGWIVPPHRLLPSPAVQAALFKKRFGEITALRLPPFALELEENRALYAFFLSHPPRVLPGALHASETPHDTWEWLLHKVEELRALDPAYPADLARGIAFYHLGDARGAVTSLREHLAQHPDGPYTLRARNHLLAALTLEL